MLMCLAVRIGSMLGHTPMDADSLALLLSHIQDFLKYVQCCGASLIPWGWGEERVVRRGTDYFHSFQSVRTANCYNLSGVLGKN